MEQVFGDIGFPDAERGIDSFDNLFAETERSSAAPRGAPVEREDAMTHQQGDFDAVAAAARAELGEPAEAEARRQVRIVDGIPMGGILYGFQKNDPFRVREYAHRLYARPSIVSAIIDWPNPMPPSPHVADIKSVAAS